MTKVKKLTIKKSNIEELKQKYQWKGGGTEADPIEISTTKDLPNFLKFKTKDLHINISNIWQNSIKLTSCRNITIYNCRIRELFLKFCWKLTVKNNEIKHIHLKLSKGTLIENNIISDLAKIYNDDLIRDLLPIYLLTYCFAIWAIFFLNLILTLQIILGLNESSSSELLMMIILDLIIGFCSIFLLILALIPIKKMNRARKLKRIKRCRNDYRKVMGLGLKFPDLIEDNWKEL